MFFRSKPCFISEWAFIIVLISAQWGFSSQVKNTPPVKGSTREFVVGANEDDFDTLTSRTAQKVLSAAFARLDIHLKIIRLPLARLTSEIEGGKIDGEIGRVKEYGDTHPRLVRVEEPLLTLSFSLFTANPKIDLKNLDPETAKKYNFAYRRGVEKCRLFLKDYDPLDVAQTEQGIKQLIAGRVDLYCDLEFKVLDTLDSTKFANAKKVRKVFDIETETPIHTYLGRRHQNIAIQLAVALKKIKEEKLHIQLREEAKKELGL